MHMQVLPQFHHLVYLTTIINQSNETFLTSAQDLSPINEPIRPRLATIFIALSLSMIILLTILGNILVLIALSIDFALRSPTHLLMGNLACADLLLGKMICYSLRISPFFFVSRLKDEPIN